jgi:hypothetical protein
MCRRRERRVERCRVRRPFSARAQSKEARVAPARIRAHHSQQRAPKNIRRRSRPRHCAGTRAQVLCCRARSPRPAQPRRNTCSLATAPVRAHARHSACTPRTTRPARRLPLRRAHMRHADAPHAAPAQALAPSRWRRSTRCARQTLPLDGRRRRRCRCSARRRAAACCARTRAWRLRRAPARAARRDCLARRQRTATAREPHRSAAPPPEIETSLLPCSAARRAPPCAQDAHLRVQCNVHSRLSRRGQRAAARHSRPKVHRASLASLASSRPLCGPLPPAHFQ